MNKEKSIFYAVYEVLENDEIIKGAFDYAREVVEFLENKIDARHLSTYIKNEYIIKVNNKDYKIYRFEDNEE